MASFPSVQRMRPSKAESVATVIEAVFDKTDLVIESPARTVNELDRDEADTEVEDGLPETLAEWGFKR